MTEANFPYKGGDIEIPVIVSRGVKQFWILLPGCTKDLTGVKTEVLANMNVWLVCTMIIRTCPQSGRQVRIYHFY